MQAEAGFVFGEKTLMDGFSSCVVDLVGDAGKVRVNSSELQIVVDFVKQVAEGGGVAIAGADEAGENGRQLLLDGLFKHGTAHDGAGGEEAEEITAGGFIEIAVGLL